MPILAGFLSGIFVAFFNYLTKKLALNIAFGLAAVATTGAAFLLFKAAMAVFWLAAPAVLPTVVYNAFVMVLPSNVGTALGAIISVDVLATAYVRWKEIFNTAMSVKNYVT